jgi:hypothetical protein
MAITPEDFAQLQERFAKILGRQPTAAETKELMADKDEMGLSYHDPLLVQLMAFKRERIALAEQFRGHQEEFLRQMGELRNHVLRETDRALVAKKVEVVQASEKQMQAELKRLLDMHRTVLTAEVRQSTEFAVREKFRETWIKEWQTEFTKDWKEKIDPAYTRLRDLLDSARKVNWLWMVASLIFSFVAGISLTLWWAKKPTPEPTDPPSQTAPVKTPAPTRK